MIADGAAPEIGPFDSPHTCRLYGQAEEPPRHPIRNRVIPPNRLLVNLSQGNLYVSLPQIQALRLLVVARRRAASWRLTSAKGMDGSSVSERIASRRMRDRPRSSTSSDMRRKSSSG